MIWFVFLCCGSNAAPLMAQTLEEEVRVMRVELQRLRQEVDRLREEIRRGIASNGRLKPEREAAADAGTQAQDQPAGEVLPLLQAQVAEQAQTKVESNSRLPLKIFGTIISNTFLNTGEANWLDIPNLVPPAPDASVRKGSFSSTMRQSRLGAIIEGPEIGSMKATGLISVDLFGGIPNFQTGQTMGIPRLLYAFARLEGERTAFEVGQDHMILAPKNPTSLAAMAFPDLYRSGNLYLRAPQARVEQLIGAGDAVELQITGGILAPIGGDFASESFTFVPPNLAGERSRRPALQARVALRSRPRADASGPAWEVGVSGHQGRERFAAKSRRSWASAVDFDVRAGRVGLGGEWFVGRNIDAFGGSLGQLAKSAGGFLEGRLTASRRLEFNGGFGTDRLFDRDVLPAPLIGNNSSFANAVYQFSPEVALSFEHRWLCTRPAAGGIRRNHHFNLTLAYSF